MKKFGILIIYFLFLHFQYFPEMDDDSTLKITTIFSKTGDAVLLSGGKFLLLGGVDYGLDRYLDEGLPGSCFIDYVYITPETNLVTFYRILERCKVGTVFYQEKDFYTRKVNLKLSNILKTQSLGSLEDKISLDLNGVSVTVYGRGEVEFKGGGATFLAMSSKESVSVGRPDYLKPPFNAVKALSAKNVLCSFKICLRNSEEYEIHDTGIVRSEDGESIIIRR